MRNRLSLANPRLNRHVELPQDDAGDVDVFDDRALEDAGF